MALTSGTQIGSYQIVSALGAGGMGEVYRAHDIKLGRDVAIKILPVSFALDADRLARFEREARLLASLNHANIAAIYGVEDAGDMRALVLELVDGQTLAETLSRASLPLPEAIAFARQICDALEAAHERGVVHRDLKPANIAITRDGTVKVLDFGLAKDGAGGAGQAGGAGENLTHSPTMMAPTVHGVLLGTAPYMSPEQARGKTVDKRTDIWAFGCVLYEMLTGRRAFPGETMSDAVAAILEREPDWSALPATTPASVRRLLARCLAKDPKRRLRDIGDARVELDELQPEATRAQNAPVRRAVPTMVAILVGAALASAAFAGWRAWANPAAIVSRDVQLQRLTDFVGMEESPAISPDGKTVVFVSRVDGRRQIWVRLLARGEPLQITRDVADHQQPRWTPDSSAIIYYSPPEVARGQGVLWEISALGGAPRRIGPALGGGDVSHDGRRVAIFQFDAGHIQLMSVSRDGSGAQRLTQMPDQSFYSRPRWSPDDRFIAFQRYDNFDFDARLYIVPSTGGELTEIARADFSSGMGWLADGSGLVYGSSAGSTVLYPPTFQLRAVRTDGTGDRQLTFGDVSYVEPDLDRSNRIVAGRIRNQSDVWRIPTDGTPADNVRAATRVTRQTGAAQTPSLSPDGAELVYLSDNGGHGNLWITRTDGSSVRQLTFERDPMVSIGVPVWSPVGDWIAFIVTKRGTTGLSLIKPDGSGVRQLVARGSWAAWSMDGRWLYYAPARPGPMVLEKIPLEGGTPIIVRSDDVGGPSPSRDGSTMYLLGAVQGQFGVWGDWEIRKVRPETGPFQPLGRIASERVPIAPQLMHMFLSPDERWLAFPLIDGATSNIWVQPTDGGAMRPLTDFGSRPVLIARRVSWSPDGKALYAAVADTDADIVLLDGLLR